MNAFNTNTEIFNLGFAVINFSDNSVVWMANSFTPKRQNLINKYFNQGHLDFDYNNQIKIS